MASNQSLHAVEPSDINKLQAQLNSIAGKWQLFVGQLGVLPAVQDQIQLKRANNPAYAQICLQDGLQHWVESDPLPTVEKVIAALSSEVISNKPLAAEIGRQWGMQVMEGPVPEVQTACTAAPQTVATTPACQMLYDISQAERKSTALKKEFILLVKRLRNHLKSTLTEAGLPDFRADFVLQLSISERNENEKFFDRKNSKINEAKTFDQLFLCFNTHWSYLNHSLLRGIIKAHGTDQLQDDLKEFSKDVKEFKLKTTVDVFCEIEPPENIPPPPGFEEFVTTHSISSQSTLEDIEEIRHEFCRHYYLHEFAFHLVRIGNCSVVITWLVPHSVAKLVKAELTQELMRESESSKTEVQSNVQAAAVALSPLVKWEGYEIQGVKGYGAFGDRDVLLIASEARLPEAVSHTPAPQLSEDERAGYLTSQGVPQDCPLDDLHIMKARYELEKRTECEIAGEEQSTSEHPLTTSYIKSRITSVFKKTKKIGVTLYYHGPGRKGTGDWCFADGFITFQDIADLYMKYFMGSVLVIHTDCSYSGSWVKSCGEFLDKQGVQPCGHSARNKGILIKLNASCRADEVAQSLYYCTRLWQNDKNTRELYNKPSKAEDPQHNTWLMSTHIRCDNETIEQPCTLPPDLTWQKKLANDEVRKRVFVVRGRDRGRRVWRYLLLVDDEETIRLYKDKTQGANAGKYDGDLDNYGKVIRSGLGEPPTQEEEEKWLDNLDFTALK